MSIKSVLGKFLNSKRLREDETTKEELEFKEEKYQDDLSPMEEKEVEETPTTPEWVGNYYDDEKGEEWETGEPDYFQKNYDPEKGEEWDTGR